MKIGDVIPWSRLFTMADVERFTTISGDDGEHQTHPDEHGRYVLQGDSSNTGGWSFELPRSKHAL
jgi:3-hydroxybutyryl-CoA dehydratase